MDKVFSFLTGDFFKNIGGAIDNLITSKEEKERLKNELQTILINGALEVQKMQTDIIGKEATGNGLQRSWRPIVMLSFAFIVVFYFFVYPVLRVFNNDLPELPLLDSNFWGLLQIGIGGYVVGRSAEKVAENINLKKK